MRDSVALREYGLLNGKRVVLSNVTLEEDTETITSDLPVLDPKWQYVDRAGHGHFVLVEEPNGNRLTSLPTLREVTETVWCDEHGESENRHVRYECLHCGEAIAPGTTAFTPRQVVTGRRYLISVDASTVDTSDLNDLFNHRGDATIEFRHERYIGRYSGGSVQVIGGPLMGDMEFVCRKDEQ